MLKTIKGKVIAGTVSVTLLAGAGAAFASSNAGANLKDWYDGQFNTASGNIQSDVATNVQNRINGLASEYNGLKSAAGNSISTDGTTATATASGNIDTAAQEHIDAINAEKVHIQGYMAGQFASLETFADGLINQAGTAAVNYANNDLTNYTGAQGVAARTSLTTALEDDTEDAVAELQQAISAAQGELQGQLNSLEDSTTENIIDAIDAKIEELRLTITAKRDALVAAQKVLIDAKAVELEEAAKAALQAEVDGI
ncbi:hypothetical protein [Paenisporosarcina quisquiliarum]|uniref:hypothetical protein n=1 Tax=Paenisporosarcina quisquiliarum TaxID=365346 RepID=UPI003736364C